MTVWVVVPDEWFARRSTPETQMFTRTIGAAAMLLMTTSLAQAASFDADAIAKQYQADGYTRIEIKIRQTQAKVEAYNGRGELEVIYDIATGKVLDRDWDDDDDDGGRPGVFIRTESRFSFIGARGDDDRWDDHDDFDDDDDRRGRHGGDDD
jgi:hypothetical protein